MKRQREEIPTEKPQENTTEVEKKRNTKAKDKNSGILVASPVTEIRGHTGYLTFAIKFWDSN